MLIKKEPQENTIFDYLNSLMTDFNNPIGFGATIKQ